jgi:hypothetical protein
MPSPPRRTAAVFTANVVALVLATSGCGTGPAGVEGGSARAALEAPTTGSTAAAPTTSMPTPTTEPTPTTRRTPTTRPTPTSRPAPTTEQPSRSTLSEAPEGERFVDPGGAFTITVDPTWEAAELFRGVSIWYLVTPDGAPTPHNVNILVQPFDGTLEEYVEFGLVGLDTVIEGGTVLDQSVTTGWSGSELGRLEYQGFANGFDGHYLSYVALGDGQAVLVTFTALADEFADLVGAVEPYLRTVEAL